MPIFLVIVIVIVNYPTLVKGIVRITMGQFNSSLRYCHVL